MKRIPFASFSLTAVLVALWGCHREPPADPPKTPPKTVEIKAAVQEAPARPQEESLCPQGALLKDGHCYCNFEGNAQLAGKAGDEDREIEAFWLGDKFACAVSAPLADVDDDPAKGSVACLKSEGCLSTDGRHYAPYLAVNDDSYYVMGNAKLTYETVSPTGDCVIPGSVLPSLNDQNSRTVTLRDQAAFDPELRQKMREIAALPNVDEDLAAQYDPKKVIARVYDGQRCEGGIRYCHGLKNDPIPAPHEAGYICGDVDAFQGHEGEGYKAWICGNIDGCLCGGSHCPESFACIDGQCVCGDGLKPAGEDYRCVNQKNVCGSDVCDCGGFDCGRDYICEEDVCVCGSDPILFEKGYICDHSSGEPIQICAQDRCVCGNGFTLKGGSCKRDAPYCGNIPIVELPEGFTCQVADERPIICTSEHGCRLGHSVCPEGSAAIDGQCFCGEQLFEGDGSKYHCIDGNVICRDPKGCICAGKPCGQGGECFEGECLCRDRTLQAGYKCHSSIGADGQPVERALCGSEKCACGGMNCAENEMCINGSCLCDRIERKMGDKGWSCVARDAGFKLECQSAKGCKFEDGLCPLGGTLGEGCFCGDQRLEKWPGDGLVCAQTERGWDLTCTRQGCDCYGKVILKGAVCNKEE